MKRAPKPKKTDLQSPPDHARPSATDPAGTKKAPNEDNTVNRLKERENAPRPMKRTR